MLTPNQLDKLPEPMIQLMSELQDEIISDICRRIQKAKLLTPTAEWQLEKANQLTISSREVKRRIASKLKVQEKLIKEIYTDAVKTAIDEDAKIYKMAIAEGILSDNYREKLTTYTRSVAFSNALKRGLKNTNGLMRNLTNSAAAAANRQLSDALDLAYLKVMSGAFTPQEATFAAVKKLGADGLKCVKYDSGRTDQLDVAVRRALVTGIGKTCCDMQLDLAKEMDCQLVEVSSHLGARPSHAEWQGQIYSLVKGHPKYPYFYDATGYGTGDGLGGWNCRHSFFPYFEGLSTPANAPDFTKSENAQVYADTQKQRACERAIRKSKRELAALDGARSETTDPVLKAKYDREFERKSVTLKNREAKLNEHLKATGLLPDNSRVRVDGFGKSVSQKAVWAKQKNEALQYSGVFLSNTEIKVFSRASSDISANRVSGTAHRIYVSDKVDNITKKSQTLHRADIRIEKALKKLGISEEDFTANIVIISSSEMPFPGAYNPVSDVLYLNEGLFYNKSLPQIQMDGVLPNNQLSTVVHELIHWKDAADYRKSYGTITNTSTYNDYLNAKHKKLLDNLEKQGYNVFGISNYADKSYDIGNFFETYTEYRTKHILR